MGVDIKASGQTSKQSNRKVHEHRLCFFLFCCVLFFLKMNRGTFWSGALFRFLSQMRRSLPLRPVKLTHCRVVISLVQRNVVAV